MRSKLKVVESEKCFPREKNSREKRRGSVNFSLLRPPILKVDICDFSRDEG